MPHHRVGATAVLLLLIPSASLAQTDTQLWANFTFDWVKNHRATIGVNAEPKILVSAPAGDPGWATLDVTPSLEYSRGQWFDMVTEMLVGRTKQTDDLDSTELTPRIGFRLHLLSNLRQEIVKERRPKRRLVFGIWCDWSGAICTTRPTSPTRRRSAFAIGSKASGR